MHEVEYRDTYPMIKRVRADGRPWKIYAAEVIEVIAITAPAPGFEEVVMEVNGLRAFVAPLDVLHGLYRRLEAFESTSRLKEQAETLATASCVLRKRLDASRCWQESLRILREGYVIIGKELEQACAAWRAYLEELIAPCRPPGLPAFNSDYDVRFKYGPPRITENSPEIDVYCLIKRALTKG